MQERERDRQRERERESEKERDREIKRELRDRQRALIDYSTGINRFIFIKRANACECIII